MFHHDIASYAESALLLISGLRFITFNTANSYFYAELDDFICHSDSCSISIYMSLHIVVVGLHSLSFWRVGLYPKTSNCVAGFDSHRL